MLYYFINTICILHIYVNMSVWFLHMTGSKTLEIIICSSFQFFSSFKRGAKHTPTESAKKYFSYILLKKKHSFKTEYLKYFCSNPEQVSFIQHVMSPLLERKEEGWGSDGEPARGGKRNTISHEQRREMLPRNWRQQK